MKKSKVLLALACAVLLVGASIMGTLAYLTSTDTVTNTFTVGNVKIKLDEAKVDDSGKKIANANRVDKNSYRLYPGIEYDKDPMVTVKANSDESYIKMTVNVSNAKELDEIFKAHAKDGMHLLKNDTDTNADNKTYVVSGYDATTWEDGGNTKDDATNTRTYTFYYKETVSTNTEDKALDALFDTINIPGCVTKEEMATINNMTITVKAYAIQAAGFDSKEEAWAAFPENTTDEPEEATTTEDSAD